VKYSVLLPQQAQARDRAHEANRKELCSVIGPERRMLQFSVLKICSVLRNIL
jgi:hypothetical protein